MEMSASVLSMYSRLMDNMQVGKMDESLGCFARSRLGNSEMGSVVEGEYIVSDSTPAMSLAPAKYRTVKVIEGALLCCGGEYGKI